MNALLSKWNVLSRQGCWRIATWLAAGMLLYILVTGALSGRAAGQVRSLERSKGQLGMNIPSSGASLLGLDPDPIWQSSENNFTSSVAWGDYDGDGDLDLAAGAYYEQPISVYENMGGILSPVAAWLSSDSDGTNSVAWGDYNGDGDLDLAAGNYGGPNKVYENVGGVLQPEAAWLSSDSNDTQSVAWGDMDGDGDLDLAAGNSGQPNKVYENVGGVLQPEAAWLSSDSNDTQSVAWGDMDGDGDLDLAAGNWSQPNKVYENVGGVLQPVAIWQSGDNDYTNSVAWGDYDGDGDLDLAAGNGSSPNKVYENIGGILRPEAAWQSGDSDNTSSVAWGDMDGDGDLDLAIGGGDHNKVYENMGGILQPIAVWQSSNIDNTSGVAWGDMDSDGDLDLAAGNNYRPIKVYENVGSVLQSEAAWQPADSDGTYSVAWGDMDDDGDLDLAAGNNGRNKVYENVAGILQFDLANGIGWQFGSNWTSSVAWGDMDGDGDLDLAAGGEHNKVYENVEGILQLDPIHSIGWQSTDSNWANSIAWGDMDGDGDLDLAAGNGGWPNDGRPNSVYENMGGILSPMAVWQSSDGDCTNSVAWGDYDGDGDLDLAAGNYGSPNKVYKNIGGILQPEAAWQSADNSWTNSVAWGDYDGDGDLDLAAGNGVWYGGQPNKVYENVGGTLQFDPIHGIGWLSLDSDETGSVVWGDMDGDGDLDLAVGNKCTSFPVDCRPNKVYENVAGILQPTASWQSGDSDDTWSIAWGDYDGDGDLDLAAGNGGCDTSGNNCQSVKVYKNISAALRPTATIQLTSDLAPTFNGSLTHALAPADGYALSWVRGEPVIPITYTLNNPNGALMSVSGYYSMDGGGQWLPALPTTNTLTYSLSAAGWIQRAVLTPIWGIPDGGAALVAPLQISDSLSLAEVEVWLDIVHPQNADLSAALRSPEGTQIPLFGAGQTSGANFWGTHFTRRAATDILTGTAPYTGTYRPTGDLAAFISQDSSAMRGDWSLVITDTQTNGITGTLRAWGLRLKSMPVHVFRWDTFKSGFFGQSDNLVFRLVAFPDPRPTPNQAAGPYQWPYTASATFPFRARGTQVRVMQETAQGGVQPVAGAQVFHIPAGQPTGKLMGNAGTPYLTASNGYLSGHGALEKGDQLVAILPITTTERYTLYYTSATPDEIGLDAHVIQASGVQTLTVSSAHPLLVFNLDISLEWDPRSDMDFMSSLPATLQKASAVLYDVSDGQMALGQVRLHLDRQGWTASDVVLYAQSGIRPRASMGGVADELLDDQYWDGRSIENAYGPGQIRLGPNWDPFGASPAELTIDWQRALAHELAHYLLFLPDNYLGVDEDNLPISTDCYGSFMTNTYDDSYSEMLIPQAWSGDCLNTIAEHTTGRTDWETIAKFYTALKTPMDLDHTNPGPATLPLEVTQVTIVNPGDIDNTLPPRFFDVRYHAALRAVPRAQVFLIQTQGTTNLTDDQVIPLGATLGDGDRVKVRGAAEGDRLCLFGPRDPLSNSSYAGCIESLEPLDASVPVERVVGWQPNLIVRSVTTTTLQVTVTLAVPTDTLHVQFFPAYGEPGKLISETLPIAPVQEMTATNGGAIHTAMIDLEAPAFEGWLRVWVPGAAPVHEAFSQIFLSPPWAARRPTAEGNTNARAWGANTRQLGAPVASGDGQVTIFNTQDIFSDTGTISLQAINNLPDLPAWLAPVGQGYRFTADLVFPRSIAFEYLQREVPDGYEHTLTLYYSPDEGQTWERLATRLDTQDNRATAAMPENIQHGLGIYALVATIELPGLSEGWNLFSFPVPETRPVAQALASIEDKYTSVYFNTGSQWKLYDATVPRDHPEFSSLVNDLFNLEFSRAYWIYATEPVTPYLGIPTASSLSMLRRGAGGESLFSPPATYYGWVEPGPGFDPLAGMPVKAWIDGHLCGTGTVVDTVQPGKLAYKLQAAADTGQGCGLEGRPVVFKVGAYSLSLNVGWDNRRAWFLILTSADTSKRVFLPLVEGP